jgi:hypothetical protein
MLEVCVGPIARVGAGLAFLFAADDVVTSRLGIQLFVIGVVFFRWPFVSEVASRWIAG